jgi:hypothetical protein
MWQIAVLTGDLVADREDLERAIAVVVGQRQHGEDDLPAEARMAWTAAADGQWIKALQIDGAAAKRRARGQPGDAEVAAVLDTQAQFLDDVLQNEVQITIEMERSGAAAEARDRAEAYWKVVKELPEDSLLRHSVEGIIENVRHETLFAEIEASEELAKLQDRLCRTGPGGSMVRAFRKLAKTHAGTKAAERALLYAALVTEP